MLEILIVDDDAATRMSLAYALSDSGHRVTEAADGAEADALISDQVFDVAICDVRLPKVDGLTLFRKLRQQSPGTATILMTAYATIPDAVATLREGAFDYVTKPFDAEEFSLRVIGRIAERRALRQELEHARAELASREVGATIVGHSPAIVRLVERIDTIAQSDAPVLICGESGTGKELVARTVHAKSPRRAKPFVAVNCAAFPDALLEAELFGHERGIFSGAVKRREGCFRAADGGTLFLNEVAEISLPVQGKLLRALQAGSGDAMGTDAPPAVDVRVISATRQNLKERVAEGRFREDLFYRLNVLDVSVPSLRDRRGDLPLLLQYFLSRLTPPGKVPPGISPRAWATLSEYPFPGNVREFAHAIERALVLAHGSEIDLEHLPVDIGAQGHRNGLGSGALRPLAVAAKEFERQYLIRALAIAGGRRTAAADILGISRKNLWEKLRQHGISTADVQDEA